MHRVRETTPTLAAARHDRGCSPPPRNPSKSRSPVAQAMAPIAPRPTPLPVGETGGSNRKGGSERGTPRLRTRAPFSHEQSDLPSGRRPPSASIPAARQSRSKLAETSSHALPTASDLIGGKAVAVVLNLFMALLSFRGISTPSLPAQGEQRRSSFSTAAGTIPEPASAALMMSVRLAVGGLWRTRESGKPVGARAVVLVVVHEGEHPIVRIRASTELVAEKAQARTAGPAAPEDHRFVAPASSPRVVQTFEARLVQNQLLSPSHPPIG